MEKRHNICNLSIVGLRALTNWGAPRIVLKIRILPLLQRPAKEDDQKLKDDLS
jgi:hypothetical protein